MTQAMSKITVTVPTKQRDKVQKMLEGRNMSVAQLLSIHLGQVASSNSLGIDNDVTPHIPMFDEPLTKEDVLQAEQDYRDGKTVTTEQLLTQFQADDVAYNQKHKVVE